MTRARRILLVHYTTPAILGGVEQVMGYHARGLRDAGATVSVLAGRGGAPSGVSVVRVRDADSRAPGIEAVRPALLRGERPPRYDALVERLVTKIGPIVAKVDRVVVHNVMTMPMNLALTEALARIAAKVPDRFIAWTHDIARFDSRYDAYRHPGEPWSLTERALPGIRYVTVSNERAAQWSGLTGLDRTRISVVTNGIDIPTALGVAQESRALIAKLRLEEADPLLILPARVTPRKRIEAAIDATASLRRRGLRAMLVVTGGVGAHDARNREYLAQLIDRAARVEGVHLLAAHGITIDYHVVVDLYGIADVLVFPSAHEGFGLPLLEAGLHRLPIVCSDIPALREIGGDEPTYLPTDADGEDVADAVVRALNTPVSRLARSARGRRWPRVLAERVLPVILEDAP